MPTSNQTAQRPLAPDQPISDYAGLILTNGLPEFLSKTTPTVNGQNVEIELKRSVHKLLYGVTKMVLRWDEDVLAQRILPVEEIRMQAEEDILQIETLVQAIPNETMKTQKFAEEWIEALLISKRHAPLFWAWQTRKTAPTSRSKRLNHPRAIRATLSEPTETFLAQYMGAQKKIPNFSHTTWPTIGTRFREFSINALVSNAEDTNAVQNIDGFATLPGKSPSVAIALSNACWAAAYQCWQTGPQDAETATLALHALCVGMTRSDQIRDQPKEALGPLGSWAERLIQAGADPNRPYAYKYRDRFAPSIAKAGMVFPDKTRFTQTVPMPEIEKTIGVTAAALALAYTPGLIVAAQIEHRRGSKLSKLVSAETWVNTWGKQWTKQAPRLSFIEQDQDNPTNALFDAWLGSDSGRPNGRNGDYRLTQDVIEQWGDILKAYDKEPWITRVGGNHPWSIKESLIALVAAEPDLSMAKFEPEASGSVTLQSSLIDLLEGWIPKGQFWPDELLTDMAQAISSRLSSDWPTIREDQWEILDALAARLKPESQPSAESYLNNLRNTDKEEIDAIEQIKLGGRSGTKKKIRLSIASTQRERMMLVSSGTLSNIKLLSPQKTRKI